MIRFGRACALAAIPLGAIVLAIAAEGCAPAAPPTVASGTCTTIRWVQLANDRVRVEVVGADTRTLGELAKSSLSAEKASSFFTVTVDSDASASERPRTPMLGTYGATADVLAFEPRYPLQRGLQYRAEFVPDRFLASVDPKRTSKQHADPVAEVFTLPIVAVPPTSVVAIYPSGPKLPENLLRFYIHFSAPMSRGEAYEHIQLLDGAGKRIEKAFLEIGEELWAPDGERFTLVFDPGRIKRGLKPREDLGPVLEAGKTYTLVIDADWPDAHGNKLASGRSKTFQTTAEDAACPDPVQWKLVPPSRSADPLILEFGEPLDHAMLARVIGVTDAAGNAVVGAVTIDADEMRWRFVPERPWAVGAYKVIVDKSLEDVAGNSIAEPFEVDVFKKVERRAPAVSVLRFEVKAQGSS